MIQSITISNFQSHVDSELQFSPGLNVITGDSDGGKSAIVKALLWLLYNRPIGDEFKNWNSSLKDSVAVEAVFDETSVCLVREDGKNSYVINGGQPLSAIKTDVPEEVSQIFNMNECNIQKQREPYFLIDDSPGERARKLNELVGMDVIDVLYKNIGSKVRELTSQSNHTKNTLKTTEEEVEKYKHLTDVKKIVEHLEKIHAETSAFEVSRDQIKEKLSQLDQIKNMREKWSPIVGLESDFLALKGKIEVWTNLQTKRTSVNKIISELKQIKESAETDLDWIDLEKHLLPIKEKIVSFESLEKKKKELGTLVFSIKEKQSVIERTKADLHKLVVGYADLLKKAGICPTCGTKIEGKHGIETIQNYIKRSVGGK